MDLILLSAHTYPLVFIRPGFNEIARSIFCTTANFCQDHPTDGVKINYKAIELALQGILSLKDKKPEIDHSLNVLPLLNNLFN